MTKKQKIVQYIAIGQLFIGLLGVCAGLFGVILPLLGARFEPEHEYLVSAGLLEAHADKFERVLNQNYTDTTGWESFVTYQVYDVLAPAGEVSFCVTPDYRFWGISFGDLSNQDQVRYVIDEEGELFTRDVDIDIGVLCRKDR